ncbi:MAG: hypothetical protein P1Q69_14695 [Candidatus Thorarchaeota archaeon]|nr:hypothetical protein [Candidatus Thorarchaeota archaeon]
MSKSAGGTATSLRLQHSIVAEFEGEAVYVNHDEKYVYAACTDLKVRVWSKGDWQVVTVLGDTSSPPLAVHVDEEHVYATCEKRVYVWNKITWGMIGWFELSYSAVTSTLRGEFLYVGAKEGRLVSIKKDTHDTSSWQLLKSDITNLWADQEIICTSTSKDESMVWQLETDGAPTEIAKLDKKDKGARIAGNTGFILSGVSMSEIKVWDRVDWAHIRTLEPVNSNGIISIWANNMYAVAASDSSTISIWDLRKGNSLGSLKIAGSKIVQVKADKNFLFIATTSGLKVVSLVFGTQPLDICAEENGLFGSHIMRTSPYDVLEVVLEFQMKGDEQLQKGAFHEAVTEFEHALQLLIDNTQALLEVPEEREKITREINDRLGQSLLRSKIVELQQLTANIGDITKELNREGRSSKSDEDLDRLWLHAGRVIKESRILSEAQAGHILSYQLSHAADILDADMIQAKEMLEIYKEKINTVLALTQNIRSEWRWLERKRTTLNERLSFLENAVETLETRINESNSDEEVKEILMRALVEYTKMRDQIARIVSVSTEATPDMILSRNESVAAIEGLLSIIPRRKETLMKIENDADRDRERDQLIDALQQALDAAEYHKMKDESLKINAELATLLLSEPSETSAEPTEESLPKETVPEPKSENANKQPTKIKASPKKGKSPSTKKKTAKKSKTERKE